MAKMFDKISLDFMNAIKGVLEAKKVNKHGHDEVGKEDDDIDNDGDSDKSDKYLHNRRKAIGKAMMKKEESEQVDEMSSKMKMKLGLYGKKKKVKEEADQIDELSVKKLDQYRSKARTDIIDADANDDNRMYNKRTKGYVAASKQVSKKLANEEAEQVDEKLSDEAKAAIRFAAGGGAKVKPLVKIAKMAKKPMGEEAEQVDELSKPTMGRYINKAKDSIDITSYRQGNREARDNGGTSKSLEKKLTKRHKGISMAVDKLTKEEIEMIEAKMAGVAPGALDCDKHMCATKVFHKEWNEGTPIKTMHADPDAEGLIEWYDVMFDHGIERVMTEDMEVLQAESHMHSKKKMREEIDADLEAELKATRQTTKSIRGSSRGAMGRAVKKQERNLAQARMDRAARKMGEEVDLDEARGRPKKAGQMDYTVHPITKEKLMHNNPEHMKKIEKLQKNKVLEKPKTEANQHIMNQLQKAKTSMQGGSTIQFTHGSAKHVSGTHAAKLLDKYAGMKPDEKEAFQKKIGHSHEQLMKHV